MGTKDFEPSHFAELIRMDIDSRVNQRHFPMLELLGVSIPALYKRHVSLYLDQLLAPRSVASNCAKPCNIGGVR